MKGGPEPLENEINEILGSKSEDRFSDYFSDPVRKYLFGSFFVPASPQHFLKGPAGHAKVPAEVPEDRWVLRECRLWFPTSDVFAT